MIIIKVMAGLGNQLQQYALYERFKSLEIPVRLDTSWYHENRKAYTKRNMELTLFPTLTYEIATKEQKAELLGSENGLFAKIKNKIIGNPFHYMENGRMYLPEIFSMQDAYLEGYWACEAYYHDIMPILQTKLHFAESELPQNVELLAKLQSENAVSVHLRRGDYLQPENVELFSGICTDAYYETAIRWVREHCDNPHFYIFSDDTAYARQQYRGEEYTIVDWNTGDNSCYDMQLMSRCKHNICANSTFSFWGARLNPNQGKIVIRPLQHRNNQTCIPAEMHELWQGFTFIDAQGKMV
ncbi:MAG: alpha-1,2-fucosyltransferase [Lachnospiraceae bacterium]